AAKRGSAPSQSADKLPWLALPDTPVRRHSAEHVEFPRQHFLKVIGVEGQLGFVLTRHWRDTPAGIEVEFWLATDNGPRRVRVPVQPAVAFVPAEQRARAEQLLYGEPDAELRELGLCDFRHRSMLGL